MPRTWISILLLLCSANLVAPARRAHAEEAAPAGVSDEELAKQLSNPVASLISVPFQLNYDRRVGPEREGDRLLTNIQPVIPISLGESWNLISRTILPVTWQQDLFRGSGSQFGLGDTVQSLFFSPKAPLGGRVIFGAGPVLLLPTGTDDLLSGRKWGAGPTFVALTQDGPWTVGILANHIWSFADAGRGERPDVSSTFLQPFLSYTTKDAWTFTLNTESTYDWEATEWSVPLNVVVTKLLKIGPQRLSVGGGVRYWADSRDGGAHDFGYRLVVTLLFPR